MITDNDMLLAIHARMYSMNATCEEIDGHIHCLGQDIGTISEVYHLQYYGLMPIVQRCKQQAQQSKEQA